LRVQDIETSPTASLRELVRGKLVGRASELQQLKRHWDLAQQARGHLILLSGEPGIGKTRLAQDLIAYAQAGGATVLRGGCYEFEATTPYLPFVESFREWAHWQGNDRLRMLLGPTAREIAKFAPEVEARLGGLPPGASLSPAEERLRLFDNVARFLQSLAATQGLLVFVDDIHWADQGTLSLLHYLLRHLKDHRVLILAAYREIELDRAHPSRRPWSTESRATADRPRSAAFRADTGALLATLFGQDSVADDFAAALYRETEGNPFFIEEVVKSLIEQGEIVRADGEWNRREEHELAIPQSVKEAIGRRLTRLAESTVDVLRTAAALGRSSRSANWRPCRRRARMRCSTRSTRRATRSSSAPAVPDRRLVTRRRRVRVHPRQDPRGSLRGAQSDSPPAPAPAHRRSAGKAGMAYPTMRSPADD
jgi:predicted ATPase